MNTVLSTNLAQSVMIEFQGKQLPTGIYKYPVNTALELGDEVVKGDVIANRQVHGGIYKAVYAFSADDYPFWQALYPELDWQWGMFGENLTMDELDENHLYIGDRYALGECVLRVTQPREPCFKLGLRFGDQEILEKFVAHSRPGTYFAVEKTGKVRTGDRLELRSSHPVKVSVKELFDAYYSRPPKTAFLDRLQAHGELPPRVYKRFFRA
jgi:MOSC domain-containing protein YiiM